MPEISAGSDYNLIKTSFAAGEVSPRIVGRLDYAKYYTGLDTCENWLVQPQGGITRRPGTRYVASVKFPANTEGTCMMPFQFNLQQNYIIERGDKYFRFYRNGGRIESPPGTPVELVTPYAFSIIHEVKWTQSADTLYIAHQNYAPRKLTRITDTSWLLTRIDYLGGPWLDLNTVKTALVAVNNTTNPATTTITNAVNNGGGLIRITDAAHGYSTNDWLNIQFVLGTVEANGYWQITVIDANTFDLIGSTFTNAYTSGGKAYKLSTLTASGTNTDGSTFAPFKTSGVYGDLLGHKLALWRVKATSVFGYVKIVNVTSTTVCVVDIIDALDATTTTFNWQEGAWSDVQGYPACTAIKDQRLIWANSPSQPQNMWASRVNDYEDYRPQFVAGTTADTDAWTFRLGTQRVNPIMWMSDSALGMLVGTIGEEHLGTGASGTGPITPNSVFFRVQTSYGSIGHFLPVRIGSVTLFITRTGRKVRGAQYDIYQQTHTAKDFTLLSEHIGGPTGFEHIYYATEPDSQIWCSRNDGQAAVLTFIPEQDVFGWARITTEAGVAQIESIAVIPTTDGLSDTVWMIVKRTVNGSTVRYVEYVDPTINTDAAVIVDNTQNLQTLTLGQAGIGAGVSATTDVATNPVWAVGQELVALAKTDGSVPATQSGGSGRATITAVTDSQHCTVTIYNAFAATTVTKGQWGIGSYSFSGANHLIAKTVQLVGDGALYPNVTVDGSGNIQVPAGQPSIVSAQVGLGYIATAITMRPDPQKGMDTIQADKKRWAKIKVRGTQLKGLTIEGFDGSGAVDTIHEISERDFSMAAGVTVPVFTGDVIITDATDYDFDGKIQITQPNPVPTAVYAIFGRLETGAI